MKKNTSSSNASAFLTAPIGPSSLSPSSLYLIFTPNWKWLESISYRADGVCRHYRWISDPNPDVDGDIVYEEYDEQNRLYIEGNDAGIRYVTYYLGDNLTRHERLKFSSSPDLDRIII